MTLFAKWLKQFNPQIIKVCVAYAVAFTLMITVAAHASINQVSDPVLEPVLGVVDEETEETDVNASPEEVDLLARVIQAEAATESYSGKVAVGAVVMNRVEHEDFPDTIDNVIYQPKAFCTVTNGAIQKPADDESVKAAEDALTGEDPSQGALYFWNPNKKVNPWVWNRTIITQIDRHVFAR